MIATEKEKENTLYHKVLLYLKKKNQKVFVVNRLDKDTAGLVCIAKHSLISNLLNTNNCIKKTYYAICEGKVDSVVINKKIATTLNSDGYNNQKREINENGKDAITYVTPLVFDGKNTLCEIIIDYGRTHQIRVHLDYIGHAVAGDPLYGPRKTLKGNGQFLHAKVLGFKHPRPGKWMEFSVEPPQIFQETLAQLEKNK